MLRLRGAGSYQPRVVWFQDAAAVAVVAHELRERAGVNLPPISKPLTASELRDRVLCQLNGESRELSTADQERRKRLLKALTAAREGPLK